jgi:diguanylate cyclase (GGDEF)-like protein/PAS domain S-box-containing protein
VNPAAAEVLGYTPEEMMRMNLRDVLAPRVRDQLGAYLKRIITARHDRGLMSVVSKSGEEHVWKYDNACHDEPGGVSYVLGHAQDITELQRARVALEKAHAALQEIATRDPLTGLCNRRLFSEHLNQGIELTKRRDGVLGLLFIDLDKFKQINDTLGHDVGDKVLCYVGATLVAALRHSDVVGRTGGDEFVVMLDDIETAAHAHTVAAKIADRLREPLMLAGREIAISASIGVACYPLDAEDADALLKKADRAMYAAKHACDADAARAPTSDSATAR